jgi:hypothetical protein
MPGSVGLITEIFMGDEEIAQRANRSALAVGS